MLLPGCLSSPSAALILSLAIVVAAVPANHENDVHDNDVYLQKIGTRAALPKRSSPLVSALDAALGGVGSAIDAPIASSSAARHAFDLLISAAPTMTPTSIPDVLSAVSSAYVVRPTPNVFEKAAQNIAAGLYPPNLRDIVQGYTTDNRLDNVNTREPARPIYPRRAAGDAPYSLSEATLRAGIFIPKTFEYGSTGRKPILMVPGTATPGGINFVGNYAKLLESSPLADPIWLNVPSYTLDDAQVTAEYVAYAIHYLSETSGSTNISVLTWSQGSIDTQWALKYWPSTRSVVSDVIAFSPDYHGTLFSNVQCLSFPPLSCPQAPRQQRVDSKFLATLRKNDGGSAYVPTTSVYSIFDEIVQPQSGMGASGFIEDARGVGASNNEVQSVCSGKPAGGLYTHEGVLYNSLGYALLVDAILHDGPANLARIDLNAACKDFVTPGLNLADVVATEGIIPVAALLILQKTFGPGTSAEPPIKSYATY